MTRQRGLLPASSQLPLPEDLGDGSARALTVGTAGHIDHGKTTLVAALTGTDTDRLAEERRRGISIELGFAEMQLPGGAVSIVDVPGHHALVRAMVAGASGIDLFLLAIAADDGVMPQTREHWTVLEALGIEAGVIALTKCDAAPEESRMLALAEAEELCPGTPIIEVSARSGAGMTDLRDALGEVASRRRSSAEGGARGWPPRAPVLHLDRAFTLRGIGTVATGTLRSGSLEVDDRLRILPSERTARARSLQVHGRPTGHVGPGHRVAVNLAGINREDVAGGDVVTAIGAALVPSFRLDVALGFEPASGGEPRRVQIHHGTRDVAARLVPIGDGFAQLRLESPLIAEPRDAVVIRRIAPPGTLGGALVIDPHPRRHGAGEVTAALREASDGDPEPVLRRALEFEPGGLPGDPAEWGATPLLGYALARFGRERWLRAVDALEEGGELLRERGRLRTALADSPPEGSAGPVGIDARARTMLELLDSDGLQPRGTAALAEALAISAAEAEASLKQLVAADRIVRLRGGVSYPAGRLTRVVALAAGLAQARGSISLAELRDDLRISRKYAQAIIERLDATKLTVRRGDRHYLRRPLKWEPPVDHG